MKVVFEADVVGCFSSDRTLIDDCEALSHSLLQPLLNLQNNGPKVLSLHEDILHKELIGS